MEDRIIYQWDMQLILRTTPNVVWMRDSLGPFNHTMHQATEPTLAEVEADFKRPHELVNYRVWLVLNMKRSFKGKPVEPPIVATEGKDKPTVDLPPTPQKVKK